MSKDKCYPCLYAPWQLFNVIRTTLKFVLPMGWSCHRFPCKYHHGSQRYWIGMMNENTKVHFNWYLKDCPCYWPPYLPLHDYLRPECETWNKAYQFFLRRQEEEFFFVTHYFYFLFVESTQLKHFLATLWILIVVNNWFNWDFLCYVSSVLLTCMSTSYFPIDSWEGCKMSFFYKRIEISERIQDQRFD